MSRPPILEYAKPTQAHPPTTASGSSAPFCADLGTPEFDDDKRSLLGHAELRKGYIWGRVLASAPPAAFDYYQPNQVTKGKARSKSRAVQQSGINLKRYGRGRSAEGAVRSNAPVPLPASSFDTFTNGFALLLGGAVLQRDILELLCITYCKSDAFITKMELDVILATHSTLQSMGMKAKTAALKKLYEVLDRPPSRDALDRYGKRRVLRALAAAGVSLKIDVDAFVSDVFEEDYEGKLLYYLSHNDPLLSSATPSSSQEVYGWSAPPFDGEQDAPLPHRPWTGSRSKTIDSAAISSTRFAGRSQQKMRVLEDALISVLGDAILDDSSYSPIEIPTREYKTPYLRKKIVSVSKKTGRPTSSSSPLRGGGDARSPSPLATGAITQRAKGRGNAISPSRSRISARSGKVSTAGSRTGARSLGRSFLTEIEYAADLLAEDGSIDLEPSNRVEVEAVEKIKVDQDLIEAKIEPVQVSAVPQSDVSSRGAESALERIKSFVGIRKTINFFSNPEKISAISSAKETAVEIKLNIEESTCCKSENTSIESLTHDSGFPDHRRPEPQSPLVTPAISSPYIDSNKSVDDRRSSKSTKSMQTISEPDVLNNGSSSQQGRPLATAAAAEAPPSQPSSAGRGEEPADTPDASRNDGSKSFAPYLRPFIVDDDARRAQSGFLTAIRARFNKT